MQTESIAIIGIGCRFPGANSPVELWDNLISGRDLITPIPADRKLLKRCATNPPVERDRIPDFGGFIKGIDSFSATHFKFSPREASSTDPQHRLMLHVTWEALEDGAVDVEALRGAHVPIYFGILGSDNHALVYSDAERFDLYTLVNNSFGALAGRVAHYFDWSGPAVGLDTACSSSPVSFHLACRSIWEGHAETAVAGGTNLLLTPQFSMAFTRAGMLASDGHCKAFDARGDGFVRSEGVAAIILKSLSTAQRDGNPIYAVVRATHLNHDGGTGQYKTPNRGRQAAMLREIYAKHNLSPLDTHYIEAHGTGTKAGDPVEMGAISDIMCSNRDKQNPLIVGSVKTNIGHCEAASGMASIIKAALAIKHRKIPANLHFDNPNPAIAWDEIPVKIPTQTMDWPDTHGKPARAGISSFGLTGVNAHIILESLENEDSTSVSSEGPVVWMLSSSSQDLLATAAQQLHKTVESESPNIVDVGRTLLQRRSRLQARAAIWGNTIEEIRTQLAALGRNEPTPGSVTNVVQSTQSPAVCFVFPGQGGQWIGMAKQLYETVPEFKSALDEVSEAIQREAKFNPVTEIFRPENESKLGQLQIVQPSIFAVQVALAKLWESFGLRPQAVIGHSMGEVAAAYIAGILTLEHAVNVIYRRSRLMAGIGEGGGMLVVGLPTDEAQKIADAHAEDIALGVCNSPKSSVLSGNADVLNTIAAKLEKENVFCRPVKVDIASHSPQVEPLKDALMEELKDVKGQEIRVPFFSTVRPRFGRRPEDAAGFNAEYWWENLRNTVLFSDSVEAAIEQGISIFIEVNPHPILCQAIQQSAKATSALGAFPTMRRNEDERLVLWRTIADLLTRGVKLELKGLFGDGPMLRLPVTPLQNDSYPVDFDSYQQSKRTATNNGLHPFVVSEFLPAERTSDRRWTVVLDPSDHAMLEGHRVQGEIVFPGAGYVDLALAMARQIFGKVPVEVFNFAFHKALFLTQDHPVELQVVCQLEKDESYKVMFYNTENGALHASGHFKRCDTATAPANAEIASFQSPAWSAAYDNQDTFYSWLASIGLQYDGPFKKLYAIHYGDRKGLASLSGNDVHQGFAAHPAVLDNCFQAGFSTLLAMRNGSPSLYLPTKLHSLKLYDYNGLASARWIEAISNENNPTGFSVTLNIYDASGLLLAQVEGFDATKLAAKHAVEKTDGTLWIQNWEPVSLDFQPYPDLLKMRRWLVRTDGDIGEKVADMLEQQECTVWRVHRSLRFNDSFQKLDHHCYRIRSAQGEDLQQLLDEIESQGGLDGVLDFWSLQEQPVDECQAETIATAVERINFPVVLLIQELTRRALSPRMWLFTHNAWNINPDAIASGAARHSLWGLGRVIRLEHPEFRCSLVDIDKNALCEKQILAELIANTNEQEIRLAAQQRLVARLATAPDEIESKFKASPENNSKQPWQIEWTKDNQITVIPASRPKLQAQQAVVNVRNCVIHAPGTTGDSRLPVNKMGTTLTGGTVESSSVDAVHPGDHIVWIGAKRSTTSSAVLRADEMWVLSPNLYLPDAIASAGPYLAAFYGLIDVAKLQHGDRVLVIADNPLALAAAHVIRWMCAEAIIAIPEGDNGEFRNAGFLDVLDLNAADIDEKLEHYFIHRTADILFFATTEPKDRTPAKYLSDTGHCLWMPFASDARPPRIYGNQTLTSLDIGRSFTHNSHQIRDAWKRVTALLNAGTLPFITMPQFRLSELLEHPDMLNNGHEAVVTLDEVPVTGIHHSVIRSDTTYLIIGGMGGLGLSICKELIESGARSLVLVGRRAASQSARQQINTLMKSGASIITLQGDMSYETDVRRILDYIADHLPPLAGVINSAGLLRDATLLKQDRQLFVQAFPPKVQCAWNLHRLTRDLPLDFFVMFSSAAGLLGSPGQANYATANTFLDGLVYARRAQGLPAQAIQWGAWAEVGLAARPDRNERLAWRGLESFAPEAGAALFTSIVERPEPVLAAMIFKPGRWRRANPGADRDMRYAQLEKPAPSDALPLAIAPVPSHVPEASERKQQMDHTSLLQKLRAEIARIARIPESRIEDNIAITELGFDSLMMVELSASIEQIFNAVIPIPVLMKGPGIKSLSEHISETIGEVETANAPTKPVPADKVQKSATRQQAMGNNSALRQLRNDVARIARIPESRLDNSVSIVHLGFDSLMMVELSVAIENSFHVQVPVAMLIKGPSLEELVEILRKEGQPESQSTGIEADLILPDEIKLRSHRQGHMKPKRVLLTGATGFLGQHLVETLMRSDVEKVSCLVRGDDGKSRLKQSVNDQDGLFEAKVEVINGDLSKPNWGLEEPLSTLLQSMDVVIHNGAAVNFIQPYEALRDTNVQSLLELLIASSENPPVLHFISTWAVFSSPAYAGKIIHENDWSEILPESGYRQSKYVAEQLVKQAIGRGFPIQVHRPALIGPHSETGERNPAEFFGALVSAALQTRTAPDIELLVPIASVDTITQGIVSSVLYGETYPHALHWCHHEPMKWKDLVAWLSQQQPIELVPYPEWRTQMAQLKHSTFSAFLPLLPENLVEGDFGYLRAAIKGNAPEVFEVNRTAALFPELESNSDFSFKVMEAFIKKM